MGVATKADLLRAMVDFLACNAAHAWVSSQEGTAQEIWDLCPRGDWLLWFAAERGIDNITLARAACLCARTALQYVPGGEDRPRLCIETVERWANGEATIQEVRSARSAAESAARSAVWSARSAWSASAAAAAAARSAVWSARSAAARSARSAAARSAVWSARSAWSAESAAAAARKEHAVLVRTLISKVPL